MSTIDVATLNLVLANARQTVTLLEALIGTGATVTKAASVTSSKKTGKGSRGPRGSSGWDLYKKQVYADMKAEDPTLKMKASELAIECKKRKEAGEYDEAYWKAQAAAAKAAGASATESDSESDAEAAPAAAETASTGSKGRGRPKGSKNKPKVAAAAAVPAVPATPAKATKAAAPVAPKKFAAPAPPPQPVEEAEDDEEEIDAEPWEFKGKSYWKAADNEVYENVDGAAGPSLGYFNPLTNKIEPKA